MLVWVLVLLTYIVIERGTEVDDSTRKDVKKMGADFFVWILKGQFNYGWIIFHNIYY